MKLLPPVEETVTGHLDRVRALGHTARAAVEECLDRCTRFESDLQAWVHLDREGALVQADKLDHDRLLGVAPGPLFGAPVAIKDLFDVAGWPTGCGSPLLESMPRHSDSELVRRLRRAGAIILGKTVTTQFACFDPPPTRNPWNVDRTPGGSSSGSAVAVATGMALAAMGSQTGGSITRPASFCGICGLKPSFGQLPLEGVYPVSPSLDHPGPMARTVTDLQLLYDVLKSDNPLPALNSKESRRQQPRSIGVLRGMFQDCSDEVNWSRFELASEFLRVSGADVTECPLPEEFTTVIDNHRTIMVCEIAKHHQQRLVDHREDYRPGIGRLIEEGLERTAVEYLRAKDHQHALATAMRRCFEAFDVLVCPATRGGAPSPETTGDPSFNVPFSYTGLPTVTMPIGLDDSGMPLGLQLAGAPGMDETLLAVAAWCEERFSQGGLLEQ